MIPLDQPYHHYRRFGSKHNPLYVVAIMLLFWSIAEGMISFASPLLIVQAGLSKTTMGFILGFSSVAGAAFDFLLSKYLQNTHFKRLFLIMFIAMAIQPLFLLDGGSIFLFLIAMGLWGLYYDLVSFGTYDFVCRKTEENEHSSAFGVISVFKSLGYLLAPLIAGLVIDQFIDWQYFALFWIFLGIAYVFYLVLLISVKKVKIEYVEIKIHKPLKIVAELHLWRKIGKIILPVIIFTILLNTIDNFFWTIGPLVSESFMNIRPFGGVFLTLYALPSLFVGWFVGRITNKYGKKRSGLVALLLGSLVLSLFSFLPNPFLVMLCIFASSLLFSFSWPAMRATYADYITEAPKYEKEIVALEDFAANIGYVIGPIAAGILADTVGNAQSFTVLGIVCAVSSLILLIKTPKQIKISL